MSRNPVDFLRDIEQACTRITSYTAGMDRDAVFKDEMRFDGILYNFHIIGEAVKQLPSALKNDYPDIPWKEIAGMRDYVAHAYFVLDLDILWRGIQEDVPTLLARVQSILDSMD